MKITSVLYKLIIGTYKALPFKQQLATFIRASGLPVNKLYTDLKFKGAFTVPVANTSFQIIHEETTIENEIFWNGLGNSWEHDTIWIWEILVKDAKTIVDIGANTGVYSLMARAINKTADIYAFEPVERTNKLFAANVALNKFNVNIEKIALSNVNGSQVFYDTINSTQTSASLNPDKLKNNDDSKAGIIEYEVKTMRLDSYVEEKGIGKIDLIKIDIEMHEPEALEGYAEHIQKHKPNIVVEVLTDDLGKRVHDAVRACNYNIYHLSDKGKMKKVETLKRVDNLWNYLLCDDATAARLAPYIEKV